MPRSKESETLRASDERWVPRPIADAVLDFVVWLGLGPGLIGGGVWGIVAPWVTDVTFWWPTLLGLIGVLLGLLVTIVMVVDYLAGTVELAGFLSKKRETGWGDAPTIYHIRVSGTEYEVHEKLFNWVSEWAAVSLKVRGGWHPGEPY